MTIIEEARSLFSVTTESGSEYTCDLREPACTCPDFDYRDDVEEYKHIRRVRIEVGQVDTGALENRLTETADDLDANAFSLSARPSRASPSGKTFTSRRSVPWATVQ